MAKDSQDRIRLWKKNAQGLREMVDKSSGLLTIGKLGNFAIAMYLTSKKSKIKINHDPHL